MTNPMSLEGKRILITGSSSGVGKACADLCAELGADIVPMSRRDCNCDLSDIDNIAPKVSELLGDKRLDGLVHSAGIAPMAPLGMFNQEEIRRAFEINYLAFLELVKCCTKMRVRNPDFSIVGVSSVSAAVGWAGGSVYCGTKGALSATVRSLAIELAPKRIRVNAVCPSNIDTPLHTDSLSENLSKYQPLGLGKPMQVANAVAFLLSDAASFITGVNLPVDGGYIAQ